MSSKSIEIHQLPLQNGDVKPQAHARMSRSVSIDSEAQEQLHPITDDRYTSSASSESRVRLPIVPEKGRKTYAEALSGSYSEVRLET